MESSSQVVAEELRAEEADLRSRVAAAQADVSKLQAGLLHAESAAESASAKVQSHSTNRYQCTASYSLIRSASSKFGF